MTNHANSILRFAFILLALILFPILVYANSNANEHIYKLCDIGSSISSSCINACRNLQKMSFKGLAARQRSICQDALRTADAKVFKEDKACSSKFCQIRFRVIDPYAENIKYKNSIGYTLVKTSTYDAASKGYSSVWNLAAPDGSKNVFYECSTCSLKAQAIKHVSGSMKNAKLVNAGGEQGEDVMIRFDK